MKSCYALPAVLMLAGYAVSAHADSHQLDEMVVTASGWEDKRSTTGQTLQVIDSDTIARSSAASITDLLAENAVGFFSEWTPAQTSLNIRGGSSDGQGRDYRSQVLVLLDGRRAGTANLSKLSKKDIQRIEILRGPSSVMYGSQAMGGVVNLISKKGTNTEGGQLDVSIGSWARHEGHVQYATSHEDILHFYGSLGYSDSNSYESANGDMHNTAWRRRSMMFSTIFTPSDEHTFDLSARTDGSYDAGFRGSSWDYDNYDDRYNRSIDLSYQGDFDQFSLNHHFYYVQDVDDFYWGSEASGIDLDNNRRELTIWGLRNAVRYDLTQTTTLVSGIDLEKSRLRSERSRSTLAGVNQILAPYDINHDEEVLAGYLEVNQQLWRDKLSLRAGVRYTDSKQTSVPTRGVAGAVKNTENFHYTTYSTSLNYVVIPQWTARIGYATGFRTPTATEYAADYEVVLGGQVLGNPALDPERSQQLELGSFFEGERGYLDVAFFTTRIKDRITTEQVSAVPKISRYMNSQDQSSLTGIDFYSSTDLSDWMGLQQHQFKVNTAGTYHFRMRDEGADMLNTDKLTRIYKYQASAVFALSRPKVWSLSLTGILRGPVWYQTEEKLLTSAEPDSNYVHRKDAFWVWNLRGSYQVGDVEFYSGINNLFDKDEHALFIALNDEPSISDPATSNGGRGNSMPGRYFYVGLRYAFD